MKPKRHADRYEEMQPEYDFSNAVRGKYYERYRRGVTIHVTDSETTSAEAPLGYGIRSRRLKLSREELNELLRHDPATAKRGGFQRFLIGLQSRVNRVSGEVDLSKSDMNMILRHGRNPSRGGWPASIRKVFGRHFDFDAA